MLQPNTGRLIIKRLSYTDHMFSAGIIVAGQLKAGENLFVGVVVHPGTKFDGEETRFRVNQIVYYSEYSAAAVQDLTPVIKGEMKLSDVGNQDLFVVAEDDVMAYETEDVKIPESAKAWTKPKLDPSMHNEESSIITDING